MDFEIYRRITNGILPVSLIVQRPIFNEFEYPENNNNRN